mmetsp:Transcript_10399/g.31781  ORF Transcript_10399/g.31781 Transcript_10399/m.31781 type:complete len:491 (-) Transcript_10399:810-2282(-)
MKYFDVESDAMRMELRPRLLPVETLINTCVSALGVLSAEQRYWKAEEKRPWRWVLQTKLSWLWMYPRSELAQKAREYIAERLNALRDVEKALATFVGRLHWKATELVKKAESPEALQSCAAEMAAFVKEFLDAVKSRNVRTMSRVASGPFSKNDVDSDRCFEVVGAATASHCGELSSLVREVSSIPNFFVRNWFPTVCVGAAGVAGIVFLRDHTSLGGSDDLSRWISSIGEGVTTFVNERVVVPVTHIYHEITAPATDPETTITSMEAARSSLQNMMSEFAMRVTKDPSVAKRAEMGDISVVMKAVQDQMSRPVYNLIAGYLLQALLIQVQRLMVKVEEDMTSVNKLIRANEINLWLSSLAPIGILAIMVQWGLTTGGREYEEQRAMDKLNANYRGAIALHELDRLLCTDMDQYSDQRYEIDGQILVKVEIMEKAVTSIIKQSRAHSATTRDLVAADLHEMRLYNPSLPDKYRILRRMRDSFNCVQVLKV